jgi:hypothetical protein
MYKMGLTRSGCTNMYEFICKMMGMGIQDGSAPADVVAKVRSEIDSCVRKATEGCQRLPEKLDW